MNDLLFKLYVQVNSDAYNACTSVQVIITMHTCVHFIEIAKHFQTKLRKCFQSDYQSKITTIDLCDYEIMHRKSCRIVTLIITSLLV